MATNPFDQIRLEINDMLVRYYPGVADSVAPCSQRSECINSDGSHIETAKSVGLVDGHPKQAEKNGHRYARPSTQNVTQMKEKGQSSFNKRALEYRTNLDLKPRPLAPKHQVKFLDDQNNGYSQRRIGRLMSPDQTSSRLVQQVLNYTLTQITQHNTTKKRLGRNSFLQGLKLQESR
ncbi:hypothetical protein FOBRF1_009273 [Fusarium oxysporum]